MAISLVSYDSSDEYSDEESDSNKSDHIKEIDGQKITSCAELKLESENVQISKSQNVQYQDACQSHEKVEEVFLPLPKAKFHDTDIDWNSLKILKGSQSGTIKISVPSLTEVDDNDALEPSKKKLKPSQKGSGLFALLPSPKKQDILIPQVTSRKKNENSNCMSINSYRNMSNKKTVCSVSDCIKSEGLDFVKDNDFFSLSSNESNSISMREMPADIQGNSTSEFLNLYEDIVTTNFQPFDSHISTESFQQKNLYPSTISEKEFLSPVAAASSVSMEDNIKLNDKALHQLCGKHDRRKLKAENVELIEISGDSIIPDSREWLTKQLTEESQYAAAQSHKKKDGPTSQQKRKHQITYLAYQAKEHELELKNQWASNRMSRKQTQAKYGF